MRDEVIHSEVGYSFHVGIEEEIRVETGAKYPNKKIVKASISGHVDNMGLIGVALSSAREKVQKEIGVMKGDKVEG